MSDEFNPETASMEELRKAAEAEALKASTPPVDDPAQVDDPAVTVPVVDPPVKTSFTSERTIDLGDGAGVQVFKGKGTTREEALEDLSDKLADAQRHATKKIREQETKLKVVEPKTTPEEDAILSEKLLKNPTEAFKTLFKQVTGVEIEDFKTTHQKEKAFLAGQEKKTTADAFVTSNKDYFDTPRNGGLINKWCALHNDFSLEGLNKAYQDLNESGLLDVKDAEAGTEQKKAEAEARRIADAAAAQSSQRTRKGSGLSTHQRGAVTPPADLTEEDMYGMTLDELRKRANQQLAARS